MFKQLVERLSDLQIRRPWVPLLAVGLVTLFFGYFASKLELRTRYDQLLPDSQPSVVELHRVEARTASAQTAMILVEGADRQTLRAFGDALVPALLAIGPDVVSSAEDGTQEARRFLMPRAGLFLEQKELEKLRDDVNARWDYEVAKEADELLDDNGPPVTIDDIEKRFRKNDKGGGGSGGDDHPDGYYERKDGTALVVIARSPIPGGDLEKTGPALARIRAVVDGVRASRPDFAPIRIGYAGDMPTGFAEYQSIRDDLLSVGATGVVMVLGAVMLYFMRLRALLVMGLTIGIALIWTFGVTRLFIGHLNVATGFLFSIVAGNGINVGILYQARYYEERRRGVPVPDALRTAVHQTWQPTIIATMASAASYVSLLVTDFSAFRDFGFIAATGMLLCWVVKTLMVPPLLLLSEPKNSRERQFPNSASSRRSRWLDENPVDESKQTGLIAGMRRFGMSYGRVFAWLVPKAPRVLFGVGALTVAVGAVTCFLYIRRDPLEYDTRGTENDPHHNEELHRVWDGVIDILGGGHEGMVVLADTPEEAHELQKKLQRDYDAAAENNKPFDGVHSLWDMVPDDQPAKDPVLLEIGERLERAHAKHYLTEADWTRVKDYMPPHDLGPFGLGELPGTIARPFAEKDGTRGRLVVVEPKPSKSTDIRYLIQYSSSFRETRLPSGKVVRGSGRAVIFSDILQAVVRDIPRAVSLSLALTLLTVLITFRKGGRHALSVLFALLVGVAGEVIFLYFADVKINFLNFAALPITFGIGVDYAINVVQRYRADGSRDILAALRTTGGAVVLCSLTTMLGYLALVGSHNRAIRSLGTIAVVGEVTCLLAAVLVLPSLWFLVERRQARRASGTV